MKYKLAMLFCFLGMLFVQVAIGGANQSTDPMENLLSSFSSFVGAKDHSGFPSDEVLSEKEMKNLLRAAYQSMQEPSSFFGSRQGYCEYTRGPVTQNSCSVFYNTRFLIPDSSQGTASIEEVAKNYFESVTMASRSKFSYPPVGIKTYNLSDGEIAGMISHTLSKEISAMGSRARAVVDYKVGPVNKEMAVIFGVGRNPSSAEGILKEKLGKRKSKNYLGREENKLAGLTLIQRVKVNDKYYFVFYGVGAGEFQKKSGQSDCTVIDDWGFRKGKPIETVCNQTIAQFVGKSFKGNKVSDVPDLLSRLGISPIIQGGDEEKSVVGTNQ